jgi:thiol:disulfide interchange protein DsbD
LVDLYYRNELPSDKAFRLSVKQGDDGIIFNWNIEDGYYLYRYHITAKQSDRPLTVYSDPGEHKDDPNFGMTEIYYRHASASVIPDQKTPITLEYQGCKDQGICYPLETKLIDPITLKVSEPDITGSFSNFSYTSSRLSSSTPVPQNSDVSTFETATEVDNDKGLVQSLLDDGNEIFVILSFLVFGIFLALTPCVFPMYPIMAATLAREGDKLTPRRGFVLSTIYVVSLAFAFAIVGAIAGLSGQNLQLVLQSPYTAGLIAIIFSILALSMFGLFEIQLPSSWTNLVQKKTNVSRGGKRSASLLGFSSALIIGPCVTAPLAGALLFIAQTSNITLGAAALFALGIGKGIPLILMSTVGGSILPRAGAWMENVKRIFGFAFLGSAIWMASPLIPIGIDLLLWGVLALGIAAFLLSETWMSLNAKIASRAIGAAALIYGATLIVGFASGGVDPLKPLDHFGGISSKVAELQFDHATNTDELAAKLKSSGKPSMVYFTADWCTTCHTIERRVLTDSTVQKALQDVNLIKVDLTHLTDEKQALMKKLNVVGPPTMLFYDVYGDERAGTRLVGDITGTNIANNVSKRIAD